MKLTLQNSANGLVGVLIVAFGSLGISGGPVYPTGTNVAGTYAGTMVPGCAACNGSEEVQVKCKKLDAYFQDHPDATDCSHPTCSENSQGIFSVTVPDSGTSTGTFVMFSQGRVFSGDIQGTADPGTQKMSGVLHATYNFTVTSLTTGDSIDVTAEANGSLNAKITSGSSRGIRLRGFAALDVSQGELNPDLSPTVTCHIPLSVSGFKQ